MFDFYINDKNIDKYQIGGKANSLVKLYKNGFNVPKGFILTSNDFMDFVYENNLMNRILDKCSALNSKDISLISAELKKDIVNGKVNKKIYSEVESILDKIESNYISIRSSSISEDGTKYSFAGMHDSYLNIAKDINTIIEHIKQCWASLFNKRAMLYRFYNKLPIFEGMAVILQEMIQSKSSGVVYTQHPIDNRYLLIESSYGIGDAIVDGIVEPDNIIVDRITYDIMQLQKGRKDKKSINLNGEHTNIDCLECDDEFAIDIQTTNKLVETCLAIERIFGLPQDIEWAYDGELWILQSRPITIGGN